MLWDETQAEAIARRLLEPAGFRHISTFYALPELSEEWRPLAVAISCKGNGHRFVCLRRTDVFSLFPKLMGGKVGRN